VTTITEVPHPSVTNSICGRRNPPAQVERSSIGRAKLTQIGCDLIRTYNEGYNEVVMKKVIFAVLLTALALFLIVPSLSWAF
jgi:hypothetical protein